MDNFAEQLVKKNETSSDKTKRTLVLVIGIILTLILVVLAFLQMSSFIRAMLCFILAALCGYGAYSMYCNSQIEYEYAFTNGEIDIDKIIAKKKRNEMISFEVRQLTDFGKYSEGMKESDDMTVVFASDNIEEHEYYAEFQHETYGNTRVVFCPDERMLDNIKKFLPSKIRVKFNK